MLHHPVFHKSQYYSLAILSEKVRAGHKTWTGNKTQIWATSLPQQVSEPLSRIGYCQAMTNDSTGHSRLDCSLVHEGVDETQHEQVRGQWTKMKSCSAALWTMD